MGERGPEWGRFPQPEEGQGFGGHHTLSTPAGSFCRHPQPTSKGPHRLGQEQSPVWRRTQQCGLGALLQTFWTV